MSKRLDVGQLFVVGFSGVSVPASAEELFVKHGVGGAILFKRNIVDAEQVVALDVRAVRLGAFPAPGTRHEVLLASWPIRDGTGTGSLDRWLREDDAR